ncbi:porin [Pelomonas sp. KK5]|uniref:porin n=1 Tax=Pelomonas sp. KK5 TaxID=1855730 RepID=UPI00097C8273|nr:porin [Pelomonas sp. KK5]
MNNKKQRAAALGAIVLACSGAAGAQTTSVTLSGQLGTGVNMLDHQGASAGHITTVSDNLMYASWLRFGASEDLGGGMTALFRLETGLNLDSGTQQNASKFWSRQSFVGLQSGPQAVTLGRQFQASTDRAIRTMDVNYLAGSTLSATPIAVFGVNRFGAASAGNGMDTRTDNSVKYRLSLPGVVEFGASVAAGEGGVSGRSYAFDVARTTASYDVGAAYAHFDNGSANPNGHVAGEDFWVVGGNVKIGDFRPYLAWYHNEIEASANANAAVSILGGQTQKNEILSAGLAWQASTQVRFTGAWYHDKGSNLNGLATRHGTKQTLVLAGYYNFSKRTELYAAFYGNRFTGGYALEGVNLAGLNRVATSTSANGLSAGIRHNF